MVFYLRLDCEPSPQLHVLRSCLTEQAIAIQHIYVCMEKSDTESSSESESACYLYILRCIYAEFTLVSTLMLRGRVGWFSVSSSLQTASSILHTVIWWIGIIKIVIIAALTHRANQTRFDMKRRVSVGVTSMLRCVLQGLRLHHSWQNLCFWREKFAIAQQLPHSQIVSGTWMHAHTCTRTLTDKQPSHKLTVSAAHMHSRSNTDINL